MTFLGMIAAAFAVGLLTLGLLPVMFPLFYEVPAGVASPFDNLNPPAVFTYIAVGGIGWFILFLREGQRARYGWEVPKKPKKKVAPVIRED